MTTITLKKSEYVTRDVKPAVVMLKSKLPDVCVPCIVWSTVAPTATTKINIRTAIALLLSPPRACPFLFLDIRGIRNKLAIYI